jgi:methionyl-tRNA synthetase
MALFANRFWFWNFIRQLFRTSAKIHHDTASEFFHNVVWKGFYRTSHRATVWRKGWSVLSRPFCGRYLPKCGNEDMATNVNNAVRLWLPIWSISTITGETPIMKSTKHWFYLWIVMKILKEWILVGHKTTGNKCLRTG